MTTTPDSPLIAKVRKLLAQADHKNTSEAEAEAFRRKAFELMMREGLTEKDVVVEDAFKVESKKLKLKSTTWREDVMLAATVAKANGAAIRMMSYDSYRGGAFAVFYGLPDQIEMCEFMFNMLVAQRAVASRKRRGSETQREFASGFAAGVSKTFKDAARIIEDSGDSILPVLKSMSDRIEAEIGRGRASRVGMANPGVQGQRAGLSADTGIRQRLSDATQRGIGAGR